MALRSGYYGLKNVTKKILEKLAADTEGMKIIKSFGDGLSLSDSGELDMTAGSASKIGGFKVGDNLEVDENGALNCTVDGGGIVLSTTEHPVGTYNGKVLYEKTVTGTLPGGTGSKDFALPSGVTEIPLIMGRASIGTPKRPLPVFEGSVYKVGINVINNAKTAVSIYYNDTSGWEIELYYFYTKD